jgi:hypothetical protein
MRVLTDTTSLGQWAARGLRGEVLRLRGSGSSSTRSYFRSAEELFSWNLFPMTQYLARAWPMLFRATANAFGQVEVPEAQAAVIR